MISFYPGPSKVLPQVAGFMQEAFDSGILSVNHRSNEFITLTESLVNQLKHKLDIPDSYSVLFASSATECWEIISQSLVINESFHFYNGAFGEKWMEYAGKIKSSTGMIFSIEDLLSPDFHPIPESADLVCFTHNETSNGTFLSNTTLKQFRDFYPDKIFAVDCTSSMSGIHIDFSTADVWFASVQKCFGLPAGLSVLACSPKAIERAKLVNDWNHYNSFLFLLEKIKDWQTSYTPNVLGMYLLSKVTGIFPGIYSVDKILCTRAKELYDFFSESTAFKPLVNNPQVRSASVLCLEGDRLEIEYLKIKAKAAGILLGNGYGHWAKNTFRVANFPAHTEEDFHTLKRFFRSLS